MNRTAAILLTVSVVAVAVLVLWRHDLSPVAQQKRPFQPRSLDQGPFGSPTNTTAAGTLGSSLDPNASKAHSPWLAGAVGRGAERDFRTRLAAIHQLGPNLSIEERKVLYAYLRDTREDKWLRPGQSFALKNDILNTLCDQEQPPSELTGFLAALWRDASQPLVVRDYALQHLAPCYSKVGASGREQIVQELLAAARETARSFAGTALLALSRIRQEEPTVEIPGLTDQIQYFITDTTGNLLARISAVQLSGELRMEQARDPIKRIVVDEAQASGLRLAAIAALGRLGTREESACLGEITAGNDERLKMAAAAALRRLDGLGE
jgi:hypothetical protein